MNYQYLPINAPKSHVYCPIERDGRMNYTSNYGKDPNYIGTSLLPMRFHEKLGPNNLNGMKSQTAPPDKEEKETSMKSLDQVQVTTPSPVFTVVTEKDFRTGHGAVATHGETGWRARSLGR